MRILVTNDDGIGSVGLHVLARALQPLGEVVVVAPDGERSGSGAGMGAITELTPVIRRVEIEGVPEAWSLAGTPALCAIFGRLGAFGGPFDLVVSGINPGANVGRAVYHSGTIGACITARIGGISAVAVSQEVNAGAVEGQALPGTITDQHWATAAEVAREVAASVLADLPAEPVVCNLNVPNCDLDEVKGWRHTTIAALPARAIKAAHLEPIPGDPGGYHGSLLWGDVNQQPEETDAATVASGLVAVTWLSPILADEPPAAAPAGRALDALLHG